jgi:fatty-acyl-CoA synthase
MSNVLDEWVEAGRMGENLNNFVRHWAYAQPDRTAVRFDGEDITWGQLDRRSDDLAAGMVAAGVAKGDVVALLMGNRPEFLDVALATLKVGAILAPLNTRQTAVELAFPIRHSGTRLVVTEHAMADRVRQSVDELGLQLWSADSCRGARELESIRVLGAAPVDVELDRDDGAFLCYTSGTSGSPKGALLTHGSVRAGGLGKTVPDGITWRDRLLLPGALAYTGGIISCFCQVTLVTGGTLVLQAEFDPVRCLKLIESERITVLYQPAVLLQFLADQSDFDTADLSSVWTIATGGSAVSETLLLRYQDRGLPLTQTYGLTESSGACVALSAMHALRKLGYAGKPAPDVRVRVVDDHDHDLAPGEIGEILLRGPTVMKEYWRQPEETAAALAGGWLHTGDLGLLDEEGYLKVVDRKKEMLISGGINVYPAEIERTLAALPGLGEFAVIAVPHETWGEVPAVVVADATGVDLDALAALCKTELADYKRPRYLIDHRAGLPRNISGKLLKRELRVAYPEPPADANPIR